MTTKEANQLNAAQNEVREWWRLACNRENIPFDSKFVVFSADNIYVPYHTTAMANFMKLRNRIARNVARRADHGAMTDLGLKRVKGNLGGTYYE